MLVGEPVRKAAKKQPNTWRIPFKELGLKPAVNGSYFQPVALQKTAYAVEKLQINKQELRNGKDFFVQGTNDLSSYTADEVVFVGYGNQSEKYNDLKSLDITGKVVLFINDSEPTNAQGNSLITGTKTMSDWSTSRFKKVQELLKLKPKLIIATGNQTSDMIARFGNRMTGGRYSLQGSSSQPRSGQAAAPVINLTVEAANKLLAAKKTTVDQQVAKIKSSGKPNSFNLKASINAKMGVKDEQFEDPNVLGLIEGTDKKDEIVIISGHYDHDGILPDGTFFPGADDNGSGTVGVLELAKAFAAAKKKDGKDHAEPSCLWALRRKRKAYWVLSSIPSIQSSHYPKPSPV